MAIGWIILLCDWFDYNPLVPSAIEINTSKLPMHFLTDTKNRVTPPWQARVSSPGATNQPLENLLK
jgi:hypothetical protein